MRVDLNGEDRITRTWMVHSLPFIWAIPAMPTGPISLISPFHSVVLTGQDGPRPVNSRFLNPVDTYLVAVHTTGDEPDRRHLHTEYNTNTEEIHPCPKWDLIPQSVSM